ncbi:MAG: hypothetical protein HDT35_05665 [Clostridiales bacterium]|nr:hypothetical protein [Clostridiales bacterium]
MSELSPKVEARDMELVPTSGHELCEAFAPPCASGAAFVMLHRVRKKKLPKTVKKLWKTGKKLLDFLCHPVVQ